MSARSVEVRAGQWLIDNQPTMLLAGELHYFRMAPESWQARLDQAQRAGCTAIASYIPWIWHELGAGDFDLDGHTDPQRDLVRFIELCAERGLWFIARPGPFQMAELKNEGIPYRIYTEHPEAVPVGWDGVPGTTATLDYTSDAFLAEVERWYAAVIPLLAERLHPQGGPIIAVQLDNEIGMLSWVSNTPDLTEARIAGLARWIEAHPRPGEPYPIEVGGPDWVAAVRSPDEAWAGRLRVDLEEYARDNLADYCHRLEVMAARWGVRDVPLLVNIHGTSGGTGETYPIGISQLYRCWQGRPQVVSGSDHYVGELTPITTTDLYLMNLFQAAVNTDGQPLTSLEFEAGTGDYGDGFEQLYDPATTELKTRLFLAQGNRLINYYLFAGGINPPLASANGDGNERIAFTGERHGFAAPASPEGEPGLAFAGTVAALQAAERDAAGFATGVPEYDGLSLGLVLDAYATEFAHPRSAVMRDIVADLSAHRGPGPRRALGLAPLLLGVRFDAVHLEQQGARHEDGRPVALMVATAEHLSAEVQQRLIDHVEAGGALLAYGPVPVRDLTGAPCTLLADHLGLRAGEQVNERRGYYPTVVRTGALGSGPEIRSGWLQQLDATAGESVLRDLDGRSCGVLIGHRPAPVLWMAAELPANPALFEAAFDLLGVRRDLRLTSSVPGVFVSTSNGTDGRVLHLINPTGYTAQVSISLDGRPLWDEPRSVPPRTGELVPLAVTQVVPAGTGITRSTDDADD